MPIYKLVLIGSGGVGKSCLTIQFISQRFVDDYDPTLEDSYRKQVCVDDEVCMLDIFDTAGQEDFSAVRDQYMTAGDGFMCVYSVTFAPTFKEVRKLFEHSLRIKDAEKVPFVIVGNKCDLEDEREVPRAEGEALAQELGCTFMECSAKVPINVDEAFHQLVREIKEWKREFGGEDEPKVGKDGKPKAKGSKCMIV